MGHILTVLSLGLSAPSGGNLADLSLRASNEGLPRPRVARVQEIDQVAPFHFYVRMPRMSAFKLVLWAFLAILGAVALAYVVGVVNPHEKVNGLWLVVAAACIYVLAFRFYGRWLARSVIELNDQRVTPAVRLNDGVEY